MLCWADAVVGAIALVFIIQQDESSQGGSERISDCNAVERFVCQNISFCHEPVFSIFAVTGVNKVAHYTILEHYIK
jgi:hypothetical protein